MAPRLLELVPATQSYSWGVPASQGSLVARYAGCDVQSSQPYAELWMGTHPSAPSLVAMDQRPLTDHLRDDPSLIGSHVTSRFASDDLPFLFKILAIKTALSIQAHPDKELAARLHASRPDLYKDSNHKPEMAIALTNFSGFCGFKPLNEIVSHLKHIPEFTSVVGAHVAASFIVAVESSPHSSKPSSSILSSDPDHLAYLQDALRQLFNALMTSTIVDKCLASLVQRIKANPSAVYSSDLILQLCHQYPGDVGIFCAFILNHVTLKPGEAMFLKANEPHAYISGDIVECMATSDNVVRAGLTPKLRDVDTLVSMLTYTFGPSTSQLMSAQSFRSTKFTRLYDPPIDEFSVLLIDIPDNKNIVSHPPLLGPSILIVTELKQKQDSFKKLLRKQPSSDSDEETIPLTREGQVIFIAADTPIEIHGSMVAYRAFVE